jgi:hypothetical protein
VLEDVEGSPGDLAALQGFDKGGLVYAGTAGGVDDDGPRLHEGELRRVDEVAGLPGEHDVQAHHVGLAKQRLEVDARHTVLDEDVVRHVGVGGQDPHLPRPHEGGDAAADPAETDQAERDAGMAVGPRAEIRSLEGGVPPLAALLEVPVALSHFLEHAEHGGDGALRHAAPVRFGGAVRHQDAQLGGRLHVHVVGADGVLGHDAKPVGAFHDGPADRRVPDGGAHEGVASFGHGDHLGLAVSLRGVPGGLAQDQRAPVGLEGPMRLRRFVHRGEDKHLGLAHGGHSLVLDVVGSRPSSRRALPWCAQVGHNP